MTAPDEMERVRAAREIIDARRKLQDEQTKLDAFMSIFHPERDRIVLKDDER